MAGDASTDDAALFDAWCGGERQAGNQLIDRHFQPVYRFFSNKVTSEIEDLVQQTFLACVEHRSRFRRESSFRTFLFAVAKFTLYEHLRARRRNTAALDYGVTSLVDLGHSSSSLVAQGERTASVAQALRRIPVDLQLALELHYWEELPTAEMAEVLEIPQGTVKSRLRRGREALATELGLLWGEPVSVGAVETWSKLLAAELRGGDDTSETPA